MDIFWFRDPGCAALPPEALAGIEPVLGVSRRGPAISAALWCEAGGQRAGSASGTTTGARDTSQDGANGEVR